MVPMDFESNNEVREIDENYAERYYRYQNRDVVDFSNIDLDANRDELLEHLKQLLNQLKEMLFDENDELPEYQPEEERTQEVIENFFEQLPKIPQEVLNEMLAQAIQELLQQLLEQLHEQMQEQMLQDGQPQEGQSQDGQQQGQQQNGEQELLEDLQNQLREQQNRSNQRQNQAQNDQNIQKALNSLVDKTGESVKDLDEKYEGNEQMPEQQPDTTGSDLDLNGQQETGSQQGGQKEGQNQSGQKGSKPQLPDIQKAMESLKEKGEAKIPSEQDPTGFGDGDQPNLDEETPVTASYSDSDQLTKLNVNWSNEETPRPRNERNQRIVEAKKEDELLKLFTKYLVKTNYYVKTYGLDKKNRRQIAKHFLLGLEHKIMTDTYSDVTEPLTFYIDMKGQCSELGHYNDFFQRLFNEKNLSIYFGYDGKVVKYVRVKKPNANLDFSRCDMCHYFQNDNLLPSDDDVSSFFDCKILSKSVPLEEYIRTHRLTRLVIFSDFDAADSIIKSSAFAKIWWFSTARYGGDVSGDYSLKDFKGEFIIAKDIEDLPAYFDHINDPSYESKQRKLQLNR